MARDLRCQFPRVTHQVVSRGDHRGLGQRWIGADMAHGRSGEAGLGPATQMADHAVVGGIAARPQMRTTPSTTTRFQGFKRRQAHRELEGIRTMSILLKNL